MSILNINNLTHIYDNKVLFDEASMSINNGEHCGVVGLNGAGKTTFMNIIAGKVIQDSGEIRWLNNIRWGYLDQHADINREMTVMEYLLTSFDYLHKLNEQLEKLYMDMCEVTDEIELDKLVNRSARLAEKLEEEDYYDLDSKIKKIANGLGISNLGYDTTIKNLSGGQRAKVILARLLLEELDVMLLDEPTNFLDIEHIDWLNKYLENFKGAFILISHDISFLNKVCKHIINIENRTLKKYTGTYDSFMAQYEQNAKQYEENYVRQQREIKKMEEYIAKNKARAATAGMANSRKKMLEKIDVMAKPTEKMPATFEFPYISLNTKDLVIIKDLEIGYNKKPILPPINLHMDSQTKLWIRGTNGLGKTTLLKTLVKKLPSISGHYHFHINSTYNYIEQDIEFMNQEMSASSYMTELTKLNQKEIRNELAKVGIIKDIATRPLSSLSGGEQVKVKLCSIMRKPCNILILDEPTNHLDVLAKDGLMRALNKFEGAIILVSHEQPFAEGVCNEVFDIKF